MHGCLLEIRQIDGNLRQVARFQFHAHRFHVAQSARRKTDGLGNLLRDPHVGRVQVHVVGDQELARAHDGYPGGGVHFRLTYVRQPVVILLHFLAQPFELSSPHVFQVHAVGPGGRRFVKENGNAIAVPDLFAHAPSQRHAIFNRHAIDRNKGHHVGRSHARMGARMLCQVDQFHRFTDAQQRGFSHRLRLSRQGNH